MKVLFLSSIVRTLGQCRCMTKPPFQRTLYIPFSTRYSPTSFWGKNGHFQTCVHAIMGRTKPRKPVSDRFHVIMPDGATMSYDVFGPKEKGKKGKLFFLTHLQNDRIFGFIEFQIIGR